MMETDSRAASAVLGSFTTHDPLSEKYYHLSPYAYCANNPVNYIDPDGRMATLSTDVRQNKDGTYTVVGAYDDGDNYIYSVGADGKRTGETIGKTMLPTDFLLTNDGTGEFIGYANVTFSLNNLTVSGSVKPNEQTTASIFAADAQRLLDWGQELYRNEVIRQSPATFLGNLKILREMSAKHAPLDFKTSLGLNEYTAISAGNTPEGKPIITTLRAIGNMTFGANMRSTKPYLLGTPNWYYRQVMKYVGAYNQSQNNGNGYNYGFPYFGEHTYSGRYIYYGFFGRFYFL